VLLDVGQDPHTYVATPGDVAAIHDAQIVFANGVGLEEFLEEMLRNAGGDAQIVYVSDGIDLRKMDAPDDEHEHETDSADPHVWFNVTNVIHWSTRIAGALGEIDVENAETYTSNAAAYVTQLEELDQWIVAQIGAIPAARRKLVTNHPAFGYFTDRYGLEQIGAVYPISPSAEPSAQDIAALEDTVREFNVPAIFTESTVNPKLAEQIASDMGIHLVSLYTGSLGGPGSHTESYLALMRFNVEAIVTALGE